MNIYPHDLVLAAALAWAGIFLGALPTRLLRLPPFSRLAAGCGAGWLLDAALVPLEVAHYFVALALLCFYSWYQLRQDEALRGKGWLIVMAGLGVGPAILLLVADAPGAVPDTRWLPQLLTLAAVQLDGAALGLAAILFATTRRPATQAGLPAATISAQSGWLVIFIVLRLGLLLLSGKLGEATPSKLVIAILFFAFCFALFARRLIRSPAPSKSGPALLACGVLSFGAAWLARQP